MRECLSGVRDFSVIERLQFPSNSIVGFIVFSHCKNEKFRFRLKPTDTDGSNSHGCENPAICDWDISLFPDVPVLFLVNISPIKNDGEKIQILSSLIQGP